MVEAGLAIKLEIEWPFDVRGTESNYRGSWLVQF